MTTKSRKTALPECESCPLHLNHGREYGRYQWVPSTVIPYAPILFVGMAPGKDEVEKHEVFVGRAGRVLNLGLEDHQIVRGKDCSLVNLLSCKVPDNDWRQAGTQAVRACQPRLQSEIDASCPQLIVTLGAEALRAIDPSTRGKGLFYWRGEIREVGGRKLLPTYHPAALLYDADPAKLHYFHLDLERAKQEVTNAIPRRRRYSSQAQREDCGEGQDRGLRHRHSGDQAEQDVGGRSRDDTSREEEGSGSLAKKTVAISRSPLPETISSAVLDIETSVVEEVSEGSRIRCIGIDPYGGVLAKRGSRSRHSRRHRIWQVSADDVRERVGVLESICGHNIEYDFTILRRIGAIPASWKGKLDDTMVLSSLINENREEQGLKTWAQEFGYGLYWQDVFEYWKRREDPPLDMLRRYNAKDVALTADLFTHLRGELECDPRLTAYYDGFVCPSLRLASELKLNGLYVADTVKSEIGRVKRRLSYRAKQIREVAGWSVGDNINSTLSRRQLMFDTLRLPVLERTAKTKQPSLSRSHLERLIRHDSSGVVKRYLELSFIQKQLSDLEQLRDAAPGFIHPTYNVGGTGEKDAERRPVRTGRWSCQSPNVQQFATYLKRHIRSRYADGYIVQWDGDQIEVRVAACYSGDPTLQRIFEEQADPYIDCATAIFGRDRAAARRFMGKRSLLAAIYGVKEDFLSQSLNLDLANRGFKERVTPDECRDFLASVYARYQRHYEWIRDTRKTARREGFVRSLTGRIRRVPLARRGDWHSLNQAINFPIQNLANDLNILAALQLGWRWKEGVLCTLVHDSGVGDVLNLDGVKHFRDRVQAIWARLPTQRVWGFTCDVPLTVTISYGKTWGEMQEM